MVQLSRQVSLAIFLAATAAAAQTTVTNNNDGSSGTVPMYSGSATLSNSTITQSNGNVGVGTATPSAPLTVNGITTDSAGNHVVTDLAGNTGERARLKIGNIGTGPSVSSAIEFYGLLNSSQHPTFEIGTDLFYAGTQNLYIYDEQRAKIDWLMDSSGNVGIGTFTPAYTLDVAGQIHTAAGIVFPDGTTQTTAASSSDGSYSSINQSNGNIGIGTISPAAPLEVDAGAISSGNQVYNALYLRPVSSSGGYGGSGSSLLLGGPTNNGIQPLAGVWSALWNGGNGGVNYSGALVFGVTQMGQSAPSEVIRIDGTGNLGIGTTTPGAKLEVNGRVILTANSGANLTFPDGTVQSTAWNGVLTGGDYAESVDVAGDRSRYEPGDVLVIDTASEGNFLKSAQPYSTSVTGIYSTRPGLVGRRQLTDRSHIKAEVPMAMTGIVPIKVSAENGPIKAGDLLVTSSTPGYAMKGTDRSQMLGAVIGKALGHLDTGLGLIEGVVTLQ